MEEGIRGNNASSIIWDEMFRSVENSRTSRHIGIDWGRGVSFSELRRIWDYQYTQQIRVANEFRYQYQTFQTRVAPVEYIGLNFIVDDSGGRKVYIRPEDHFVEYEDLFKV